MPEPATSHECGSGVFEAARSSEREAKAAFCLQAVLPVGVVLFLLAAGYRLVWHRTPYHTFGGYTAFAAGLVLLGAWMWIRRGRSDPRWAHLTAAVMVTVTLVHIVLGLRGDPESRAMALLLLIAACGFVFHHLGWYAGIVGAALFTGWSVTSGAVPQPDLAYWTIVLLTAAVIDGVAVYYRLWKHDRECRAAHVAEYSNIFRPEHLEKAVAGTRDGLWFWDLSADTFHFSPAWAALLGYENTELQAHPDEWLSRVHPGYVGRLRSDLAAHLYGDAPQFRNEHRIRRKDGTYMWVLARGTVQKNEQGEPSLLAGSHSDITPLIEVEKRLLTDTFRDALTGLANRNFLVSHLEMVVEEKRMAGRSAPLFALMFLDLDKFKQVNDTMGHQVGDELLIAVAGRLRNCARPDDVVARFGGDEFVILLRKLKDANEACLIGERIRKALSTPFHFGDRVIEIGGSVGIALSTEEFGKAEEILHFGDVAMYQAKLHHKGQVCVFDKGLLAKASRETELQSELAHAISRGELLLHYQPCIEMSTGRITGLEALLRWRRANGELLLPGEFIDIAEESGLIHEIGEWALRSACAQNRAWQKEGMAPVRVAVNISPRQMQQRDLARMVQRILGETGLDPKWLELEMQEGALIRNPELAVETLRALDEAGVRTAMDNFGAGASSFQHLRRFPVRTLKMDRRFVGDVMKDGRAAAMARGLITMAHNLDLSVIAEGVEEKSQLSFLSKERCDQVQGYLLGRPIPGEEVASILLSGPRELIAPAAAVAASPEDLQRLAGLHADPLAPTSQALHWAAARRERHGKPVSR
jgi:diguanylate cyclase (GGDEF)-like protein/PAS domain S-box-containing protein